MARFEGKSDPQIDTWIKHHEKENATDLPFYRELLEERARRQQSKHKLNFETSLEHLKQAAINQTCTTYGALASASGVEWSQARHQMNGANGHLDRLLEICHARGLPPLTAICVNQSHFDSGELGEDALVGFATAAKRLGMPVVEERKFHHDCRDQCWTWGRAQD